MMFKFTNQNIHYITVTTVSVLLILILDIGYISIKNINAQNDIFKVEQVQHMQ